MDTGSRELRELFRRVPRGRLVDPHVLPYVPTRRPDYASLRRAVPAHGEPGAADDTRTKPQRRDG